MAVNERSMVIGGTFFLFLVSSAIVTYEQVQIGNLKGEIRHLKILMKAGVRSVPSPSPASSSQRSIGPSEATSFESDTVNTAMGIKDFSSILPQMVSQGASLHLTHRSQVRFIAYHLVVFELQNEKGQTLPVLFNVEDPLTAVSWRYLYSFNSH